jgi:hypothetical protein
MSYHPQPGDRVHIMLPAAVGHGGAYYVVNSEVPMVGDPWGVTFGGPGVVRVEPAPVTLPTGWAARIRATVTCGCGDPGSGEPIPDVLLVNLRGGRWRVDGELPCGCEHVIPQQDGGEDHLDDVVVLDPGEPT